MSLEKKRRAIGNLEQDLSRALSQDPFVALDDLLIRSGLMPQKDAPLTLGWGKPEEAEPSALRLRAALVADLIAAGLGQAQQFRMGERTAEMASEAMQSTLAAAQVPFDGFERLSFKEAKLEKASEVRWTFDGTLLLEGKLDKQWVEVARYKPSPELLGIPTRVLEGLAKYEAAWRLRDEQTTRLEDALAKVEAAWDKHPARKAAQEYMLDDPKSDVAVELQRITSALNLAQVTMDNWRRAGNIEKWGWQRSADQAMFEVGQTFDQARKSMDAALSAIQSTAGKTVSRSLFAEDLPKSSEDEFDSFLRQQRELRALDAIVGHIDKLYELHPIRRRFQAITHAVQTGEIQFDLGKEGLDQQIETLESLNMEASSLVYNFTEGYIGYESAKARLEAIRNELAAVDGSFEPSQARTEVDRTCAAMMAMPRSFRDMPANPVTIDEHRALPALAAIEGDEWLASQLRERKDPTGFLANRDAWRVLRGLGERAVGLTVGDLLDGGGIIHGNDGRLYEVLPDGRIALLATSADDLTAEAAETFGLTVT